MKISSKFSTRLHLVNKTVLVIVSLCIVLTVNHLQKQQALENAEKKSLILLQHNLAVHSYFNQQLKPQLFELTESIRKPNDFDPTWMSSTYAVRSIDALYRQQSGNQYYYKEAAINARSPENEADKFERDLIERLKQEPSLQKLSGIRTLEGKPYFYTLIRGESMEQSCLRCHSVPDKAPGDMVRHYGPERSFNRIDGELVSAISIRVPLSEAYQAANQLSLKLSLALIAVLLGMYFLQQRMLRSLVTAPLARLQAQADAIANNPEQLGQQIPLETTREMNAIASSFNTMSARLKDFIENLEQTVAERTRDLSESERKLRLLFEHMTTGFAMHQMLYDEQYKPIDYRFIEANPAFEQLTGLKADAIIGRTVREILPDTEPFWIETYARVTATGQPASFEYFSKTLGKHFQVHAFSPQPGFFATIFSDITQRQQAIEALRHSEERFRDIAESMADWIWETDANGHYSYCSPSVTRILGYQPEEMIGKSPFDFMTPDSRTEVQTYFARIAKEADRISNLHNWNITKDGQRICICTNGVPILNNNGQLIGYRGVDNDVTETLLLEQQLRQSQKLQSIGRLTAGIAHDFNNKLMVIRGNAELAQMALPDTTKLQQRLELIIQTTEQSRDITGQLLAFSRQQPIMPRKIDLNQLLTTLQSSLTCLIGDDIQIIFTPGQDIWPLFIDPIQIDQIVMNLALNARDAMPQGGQIVITTANVTIAEQAAPGEYVLLSVADTGSGMDADTLEHIFEPFFTTKDVGKGTGLGLATIHGIVVQNSGFIEVASQPGHGTTFKLYLPRHSE